MATKPINLTPSFPLTSMEEDITPQGATSIGDFVGEQSINVPMIIRQNFMQSANFIKGSAGWRFEANGDLEANNGTFRGALIGNSLDIPDTISSGSFHIDSDGNAWWGATTLADSLAKILKTGFATFQGASSLSIKLYTDFEATGRFQSTVAGSGVATFGAAGLNLYSGATGTSYATLTWLVTKGIFDSSPTFSATIIATNISDDATSTDDRQRQTDIFNINTALDDYFTANSNYPTSLSALVPTQLSIVPTDPRTGANYRFAYKDDNTDCHIGANFDGGNATELTNDSDFNSAIGGWTDGFNGSDPVLDFQLTDGVNNPSLPPTPSTQEGSAFIGLGKVTVSGTTHTFTTNDLPYAGFFIQKVSGTTTLYAIQSDGSGSFTQSGALTTVYDNDILDLIVKVEGTSKIDYYWRKNIRGGLSKTTLDTTIPTTTLVSSNYTTFSGGNKCQFSTSNETDAKKFDWTVVNASYER